jgi:hypothetical protein
MRSILASLFLIATAFVKEQPADLVLKNANIYTVDGRKPRAQAIAVKDQKIRYFRRMER